MPRDIPVGNGKLLITFDNDYQIRDIYYPHVGEENHTVGHPFRFGLWVEDKFSWVNNKDWHVEKKYFKDTLVTDVIISNEELELKIQCHDTVDFHRDAYLKMIYIQNLSNRDREVRLFFSHDFHIYGNSVGDTAVYDPESRTVIHYKNRRYFLIGGCCNDSCGLNEFATGIKQTEGKEGTWRDAEDGRLSNNPISQGAVDSTISMNINIKGNDKGYMTYWIAVGKTKHEVLELNKFILNKTPQSLIKRTSDYWKFWVNKEENDFGDLSEKIVDLYKRSLLVLRTQIDNDGAIIAANDTDIIQFSRDTYSYMWPRDGALVAYSLDLAGYPEISRQFFLFCADVVEDAGYFLHKYNPDKSPASSWHPWEKNGEAQLPIQEDETALIIWALWKHFSLYRDVDFIRPLYKKLIKKCADFLVDYRDKNTALPLPSYDLWEERRGILTFTTCTVYAGLIAASNFTKGFGEDNLTKKYRKAALEIKNAMDKYLYSKSDNRFYRMINFKDGKKEVDNTVDASMFALFEFGVYQHNDPRVINTMEAIRENLWCKTGVGGVARYQNDYYYQVSNDLKNVPGNPWFICTLWLAEYEIERAETIKELKNGLEILKWVTSRALPSGVLAEQVHPYNNTPLSVSPLTWSHATYVITLLKYLKKEKKLKEKKKN